MSLAAAVTIRVGYRLGQGQRWMRKPLRGPGLWWVSVWHPDGHFHGFTAGANRPVVQRHPEVVTLAAHLMLLAAVYQILTLSR